LKNVMSLLVGQHSKTQQKKNRLPALVSNQSSFIVFFLVISISIKS